MAAVTICSDFGNQEEEILLLSPFPFYLPCSNRTRCLNPSFFIFLFSPPSRDFSFSLLSAIGVVSYAYLRLLMFLLEILISAYLPESSLVAHLVKNLPPVQETLAHPWVGKVPWRRAWQPTLVVLPGKSHDRGAWWVIVHGLAKGQTRLRG